MYRAAHRRILGFPFPCIWCYVLCIPLILAGCSKNTSSKGADSETTSSETIGSDSSSSPEIPSTDSRAADSDSGTTTPPDTDTTTPSDTDTQSSNDTETVSDTIPDTSEWENAPGQPCVMYVHDETGDDADDGRSWKNAKQTIQSAIDEATGGGCTYWDVWVAKGTYYPYAPNDRFDATLQLKSHVTVYGGFLGYEIDRAQRNFQTNETIISGNIGFPDMTEDNACHVVTGNITLENASKPDTDEGAIDGFTIQDGNAIGCSNENGAGITNAIARNCVIAENTAKVGGGAYDSLVENSVIRDNTAVDGGGAAEVEATDVIFERNTATGEGGGANRGEATRCTFSNNSASIGGGTRWTQVNACRFVENTATEDGGGAAGGYIRKSRFLSNTATQGGGIADGNVWDSYFEANSAENGGGMFDGHAETSTYVANTASVSGGGVSGTQSLLGTFVSNTAPKGGAAFQAEILGAVLAGNTATEGGAVYEGTVSGCTFLDNRAETAGAAIYNGEDVTNSIFEPGTVVGTFTFCAEAASPADIFAGYPLSEGQWTEVSFDSEQYQTTLVAQSEWTAGHLAGQFVKLLGTADAWREIVSNTENSIVVQGDVSTLVQAGDPYAVYDLYPKDNAPIIDSGTNTGNTGSDRLGTSRVDIYTVDNTGEGPPWVDQGAFEFDDGERFVDFSFPEREVNCESDAIQIAKDAINALYDDPEYTGCSEAGIVRQESAECVFRDRHFTEAFAPVHYCSQRDISVRRDMDESAFWQAALATMGDVYCDDDMACVGSDGMSEPNCGPTTLPWCVENQCSYEKVCDCGDGTFYPMGRWCDGTEDCANGGDEAGC